MMDWTCSWDRRHDKRTQKVREISWTRIPDINLCLTTFTAKNMNAYSLSLGAISALDLMVIFSLLLFQVV
jgi:hypothetical protein